MSTMINTNVMSLNSQRNLASNSASLATTIQRLSSGLRINSARDDAAGLAISERFTTQIRGMNQAARNANDGISLAQTAEGALGEIGNNLQRIRELAVQSRNASNSASDRAALNAEAQQLKSEIDRVANQTEFNGLKLLDGSFTTQSFQIGANQGQTIDVSAITDANVDSLGSWTSVSPGNQASVSGTALTDKTGGATFAAIGTGELLINGVEVTVAQSAGDATGASQATAVAAAINGASISGVTATANGGQVVLTSANNIVISGTGATASSGLSNGTTTATALPGSAQTGFASLDISTAEGADNAILAMDAALTSVSSARADMGAVQNRFQSVIQNLQTTSENLSASRSRIRDTDFAKETAELARTQILAQAGTAMLAQANQASQSVLSLLR